MPTPEPRSRRETGLKSGHRSAISWNILFKAEYSAAILFNKYCLPTYVVYVIGSQLYILSFNNLFTFLPNCFSFLENCSSSSVFGSIFAVIKDVEYVNVRHNYNTCFNKKRYELLFKTSFMKVRFLSTYSAFVGGGHLFFIYSAKILASANKLFIWTPKDT